MNFYSLVMFSLFFVVAAEGLSLSARICRPNESYDEECQTCSCNGDGTKLSCIPKLCIHRRPNKTVKPCELSHGRDSDGRCRDCFCGIYGYMAECPKLNCSSDPTNIDPDYVYWHE